MLTVGDAILKSAKYLAGRGVDSPRLDAELLLCQVLGCDRVRLYMDWPKPLIELEVAAYRELIRQRGVDRVPVARLVGEKDFYGRKLIVGPGAFVPRPETEGVVERALVLLATEAGLQVPRPVVFEVGTGSGCIITALAAENPTPRYLASDVSEEALAVARRNAARLHVGERVDFRHGAFFADFDGAIHLVLSNPPYIATGEIASLPPEVSVHDPHAALDGGADGLVMVREMVARVRDHLVPGGWIVMELGEDQEAGALFLLSDAHGWRSARMEADLAGRPRYAMAQWWP